MIKYFLLIILLPVPLLAMQINEKYVIGIANDTDKVLHVKLLALNTHETLLEKNMLLMQD